MDRRLRARAHDIRRTFVLPAWFTIHTVLLNSLLPLDLNQRKTSVVLNAKIAFSPLKLHFETSWGSP
eukprot:m.918088 g.918088  ORF g.918088 m.918088 type:complete len:67 (+) comp23739_c0_seq12:3868-4068(+)